jgi:polyisoprenoid-binding protein YceI
MKTVKTIMSVLAAAIVTVNVALATEKKAKPSALKVDVAKSVVKWDAKKVTGEHNGTVSLANGSLTVNGNKITAGEFSIDMTTIKCTDLTDAGYNGKFVGHLKSEDFFSVEKNPTANFKITKVENTTNGNVTIFGDMTIKGIKQAISFPATVKADKTGLTATAKITLDRTKWDIRYGSKTFFANIGDKAIYDDFVIDLALVATK